MKRVLGVLRLSRASDESTAIVRQRAEIQKWADDRGYVIVGWAEDDGVSGGIEPWKRPGLGEWLPSTIGRDVSDIEHRLAWEASRASDFDVIAAWKLDRLSRRVLHVHTLAEWCEKHGKQVASTADRFDLSDPMGRVFFSLIASFAEGELEAIKARAKSSYTHLMTEGRWRGGFVPYGYRPEKQETGDGWRLVLDDVGTNTASTLREIVRRIIDGESANSVCRWLNEDRTKTPPPLDAQRIRAGKAPKGALWRVGNLIKMLRSHTLLGQVEMTEEITLPDGRKEKRTRLVRDKETGLPLQRAEPLISKEDWDLVNKKLKENSNGKAGNRYGGSPLLRVAFCTCGQPLYRYKGRSHQYYRCAMRAIAGQNCEQNQSISAPELERVVEDTFLRSVGKLEIVRKVFRPGVDYTNDIAEVTERLKELREDRSAGLYSGEAGAKEYRAEYARLENKRQALQAQPTRPDGWEEYPTGETYRERWATLATAEQRSKELREAGVKVIVHTQKLPPMTAVQLMSPEGHEGMWQTPIGRVQILIPMDFKKRIRNMTAIHSES
ncbi:recombinase family protein [Streptomyces sp. CC208A]|uniref:recombinase family protein n=1 Tax=Streptomyces sp. CC208A TaxID=3044573 RepID=UPI0024A954B5|nr:recombinase family protein [Streptomyces sp. CC208A]